MNQLFCSWEIRPAVRQFRRREAPSWFQWTVLKAGGFGTTRLLLMSDPLRDPAVLLTQEGNLPAPEFE
jgi:hypothetical protein